jgi:fructose-bisphosphate aldolase class II
MALVTSKEMFQNALKQDYAVGAFNVNNMEIIQGIVDAAKIEQAALILQVSAGARKYARPAYLVKLVEAAVLDTGLDICLHLDHGEDFEICKKCVDDGFTSVMIDGSRFPLAQNIELTKQVVEYAHSKGVVVEAELGKLAGIEDDVNVDIRAATFTDPEEAAEFVAKTGVDSLAIAIGTSHGAYKFKGDPYLDFDRLKKIHSLIPNTPLVLHGASTVLPEFVAICNQYGGNIPGAQGVPEEMILEAAKHGVCKVNIDTDLRLAEFDPRKYLGPARDAIQAMVQHKIKNVLNASGSR